ncbi:uncharacterized protein LOC129753853 [Uranotaenia lowii]|uniref:uncharacterized protein LOC129753853 n=1 Tax=Uranotaenia lowii TaxID=190385 RepID=UPI00247971F0|nr:uncharacterized protein LOC129753853 [Uranotaenia lowii]
MSSRDPNLNQSRTTAAEHNCLACSRPDGARSMVACDACDNWWHFDCIGVTESVANRSWICGTCEKKRGMEHPAASTKSIRSVISVRSNSSARLRLQQLEEQKALEDKIQEKDRQYLSQKHQLELEIEQEEAVGGSVSSFSARDRIKAVNHWVSDVRQQANPEVIPATSTPLSRNVPTGAVPKLFNPIAHQLSVIPESNQTEWQTAALMPTYRATRFAIPPGFSTVLHNEAVPPTENPDRTCVQQNESNQRTRDIGQLPDKQFPAACTGVGAAPNPYGIHGVGSTDNSQPRQAPNSWAYPAAGVISAQQIAARQVVSRDLPKFSGDPLEWPMFVNAFESTTRMCGIQPDENLARLQRALIGNAREKVLSILTIPSAVPQIITTLRDECGRPDQLVNCLLTRIRTATQPNANKLGTLVTFGREVRNLVTFMEAAHLHSYLSSPILLTEMVSKLPPCLQLQWGHYLMSVPVPNLEAFCNFISTIRTAACNVSTATESSVEVSTKREKREEKVGGFLNAHQEVTVKPENPKPCLACDSVGHKIRECERFRKLSVSERWKIVERKKMCRRCLFPHGKWPCRTKYPCGVDGCSEAHHKLLHSTKRSDQSDAQSGTSGTVSTHRHSRDKTLFKILPVRLFGNGKSVAAFAFLDDGSDLKLIENESAEELGLEGTESPLCLEWTNNVTRNENSSRRVNLAIAKINGGEKHLLKNVRTVRNLGLPKQTVNYPDLVKLYPHLRGLPVESYNEATPSILIGVDHARLIMTLGKRERRNDEPVSAKTRLGWVVFGGRSLTAEQSRARVNICRCASDEHLEDIVREFVSSDTIGIQGQLPPECEEDMRARKILEETTVRTASGRIQTGLLWRSDCVKLPNSYHMAKRRNDCLERRLAKDPELKANITKQILEYRQYVGFRVGEILSISKINEWRWIPSKMNVADDATKWGNGPNFCSTSRWFVGPEFLYSPEDEWPNRKPNVAETPEEIRSVHIHRGTNSVQLVDFSKFSSFERLVKVFAYIHNFIDRYRPVRVNSDSEVVPTQKDYEAAEISIFRKVQSSAFPDVVEALLKTTDLPEACKKIPKSSSLAKLSIVVDENGILRASSRINSLYYSDDFRNPIILPRSDHVTALIVLRYHQRYGHANTETVLNELQQRFYIPKFRATVKSILKTCMWCRVYRAKPDVPKMAPLPHPRVKPYVRPFTFTGLDYFGPLTVKRARSSVKRWVCLFTCLSVRAIHLEVVYSLSTVSCIRAVRRFVAKRGPPQHFFSDNGTNFRGASRELINEVKAINQCAARTFTNATTEWHFNPPSTPHMGGVWERKVRSVKDALKSIAPRSPLDDEELMTLLAEVEMIVNSHPLTFVPLDSPNAEVLTPNSFLLMSSSGSNAAKVPIDEPTALNTN